MIRKLVSSCFVIISSADSSRVCCFLLEISDLTGQVIITKAVRPEEIFANLARLTFAQPGSVFH